MYLIDDELKDFIESDIALLVGTRNADLVRKWALAGRPASSRAAARSTSSLTARRQHA